MTQQQALFARFHAVTTGTLRLDGEAADAFASHVAHAHRAIHVVSSLCTSASALADETLAIMLERWFRLFHALAAARLFLDAADGRPADGLSRSP